MGAARERLWTTARQGRHKTQFNRHKAQFNGQETQFNGQDAQFNRWYAGPSG